MWTEDVNPSSRPRMTVKPLINWDMMLVTSGNSHDRKQEFTLMPDRGNWQGNSHLSCMSSTVKYFVLDARINKVVLVTAYRLCNPLSLADRCTKDSLNVDPRTC